MSYKTETVYEGSHYMIPNEHMESWFSYIKDLSVFQKDSGNLLISFSDKFRKYIVNL